MNKLKYILIFFVIAIQSCNSQKSEDNKVYNKDFNWTISIPENFKKVNAEEWLKLQNKGLDALEKTTGEEVVNQTKTIFVFKSDQLHYLEANYQPFDVAQDGNYLESCKKVNDVLIETLKNQIPDAKIERITSSEKIDGLVFQTFTVKVEFPNKMVMTMCMYSRLFGKKEFAVNITYVDKLKGEKMLKCWRNSTFKKQ
jgi:hypothetical protein